MKFFKKAILNIFGLNSEDPEAPLKFSDFIDLSKLTKKSSEKEIELFLEKFLNCLNKCKMSLDQN